MAISTIIKNNEKLAGRILLAAGLYVTVGRPLLQKLNIIDTKEEKDAKKVADQAEKVISSGSQISPYNYAAFFAGLTAKGISSKNVLIYSESSAANKANIIRNGLHLWNITNQYYEEVAFGVLEACKTQSQWAWICRKFYLMYGDSLFEFLKSNLTDKEFSDFNIKLLSKPVYK